MLSRTAHRLGAYKRVHAATVTSSLKKFNTCPSCLLKQVYIIVKMNVVIYVESYNDHKEVTGSETYFDRSIDQHHSDTNATTNNQGSSKFIIWKKSREQH